MPVGFNSPARNLFLIGSSGEQVVTNFFKTIDQSAGTDGVYFPDEIKYNFADQKFLLAGSAQDSNSKGFGWFEKRNPDPGNFVWTVRVEAGAGVNTTLRAMELDDNDNLIVVGKTGNSPWIAKYGNNGLGVWEATTFSGDVEYTGVTSDSNGNYYACGSTPTTGDAQAFVEKFDTNGNPGWGKSAFMLGRDVVLEKIAANSRGEVVAVGLLQDDEAYKGYIVKIDTNTGEVLWDRTLRSYEPDATFGYTPVFCEGVFIDSKDQIYVVGRYFGLSESRAFIVKYTAEGNMVWQKETPVGENIEYYEVKSDGETEQTVVFGRYFDSVNNDWGGILSKYSKDGTLVWRRKLVSSHNNSNTFGQAGGNGICLDADPSFYYLMYFDDVINGLAGTPDRYTFGKVSSSGNGLGGFEYTEGTGEIVYYDIVNIQDRIGKLSDGSVRNDTSDSITYPFNANKILFDDLTTQIANKKRQMDGPDSFEYSGSPAIRPADFQELNLGNETINVTEFVNGVPTGQAEYTTAGTFSWTAPADVTSVSVVAVGGGGGGAPYSGVSGGIGAYGSGGGGGGLGWKNNIPVTPGQTYTVVVGSGGSGGTSPTAGGDSYFINTSTVRGGGGDFGDTSTTSTGGTFTGDGGGNGGNGAYADAGGGAYGGGGGAGGYSGNGGSAAVSGGSHGNGSGGGGGGGFGSGGGVGIYGEGANGTGGFEATGGSGGAAGQTYTTGSDGGLYGGGAGCSDNNPAFPGGDGAGGAVRIIWGEGRSFPSTLTADQTPAAGGLVQQTITKVKDKSGKGNNALVLADLSEPFPGGGSTKFSGGNLNIFVTNNEYQFDRDFSIEFFFKGSTQSSSGATFIEWWDEFGVSAPQYERWAIKAESGGTGNMQWVRSGTTRITTSGINVFDNQWHHHAIMRFGSTITYYIDGVSRGTESYGTTLSLGQNLLFGASAQNTSTNQIIGNMSNVRITRETLFTQATYQLPYPFAGGFTPPTTPLENLEVGTYLLTLQNGSYKNNATNYTFQSLTPSGDVNSSLYWEFDGADNYILPDITAEEIGNEFTIEGWFRPSSFPTAPNYDYLISVDRFSGSINWALCTNSIGQLRKLGTGGDQTFGFGTLSTNTWYHIVMVHRVSTDNGVNSISEFSIYLNGALVTTIDDDYDSVNAFGKLTIGNKANVYGSQFNGDVGEVRLYQRLLTPAQVFQNYNATREKYTGVPASTDPGLTSTIDGFPG